MSIVMEVDEPGDKDRTFTSTTESPPSVSASHQHLVHDSVAVTTNPVQFHTTANGGCGGGRGGRDVSVLGFGRSLDNNTVSGSKKIVIDRRGAGLIGLNLTKSQALIDSVEMALSKELQRKKREDFLSQPNSEKLKASNFPAVRLKIGTWERVTKNEGDLVAKLYYAKRKLVWEFLEGTLKSKIEIQWSEISAIKAFMQEGQPGHLEIELNHPPQYGREIDPQPRKHTQWKPAADFTGGQAPICRRHSVTFPPGVLDKPYEKLLQCDSRLYHLSQQQFPAHNYRYFFRDLNGYLGHSYNDFGPFVPGCSSVPVSNVHHHLGFSLQLQHLQQQLGPHIQHPQVQLTSSHRVKDSTSPMSVMEFPKWDEKARSYLYENQRNGCISEQRGNNQTQGVSCIPMGVGVGREQDNPHRNARNTLSHYRQESRIRDQLQELQLDGFRNQLQVDSLMEYTNDPMFLNQVDPLRRLIDQQQQVQEINHLEYVNNGIYGVDSGVDDGLAFQALNPWVSLQVDANESELRAQPSILVYRSLNETQDHNFLWPQN